MVFEVENQPTNKSKKYLALNDQASRVSAFWGAWLSVKKIDA
jgi:hypothetical protein